jgi:hypothetical protein
MLKKQDQHSHKCWSQYVLWWQRFPLQLTWQAPQAWQYFQVSDDNEQSLYALEHSLSPGISEVEATLKLEAWRSNGRRCRSQAEQDHGKFYGWQMHNGFR